MTGSGRNRIWHLCHWHSLYIYGDVATTRIWMSLAVACICYSDSNYSVDRSHNQSDIIADERRIRLNFIH